MDREEWLKGEIAKIKAGGTIRQRCTMSTSDRMALGFCLGDVPDERAHRCLDTCSPECALDKKRLRRWEASKGKCRACGHGLPRQRKPKEIKEVPQIPDSGNESSGIAAMADLVRDLEAVKLAKRGLLNLIDQGVTFDEARYGMANELKITMGEATKRIEAAEEMAGLKLER